ncbi:ComF family protein [Microbulbifer aggregans]|uniref:ComF family protein n=1 Tax=Microbulbifer aggregans TaxID=1769779 RepID=UPI001CFC89E5|nr:ComF family protein [Microbulbifer aggregans]
MFTFIANQLQRRLTRCLLCNAAEADACGTCAPCRHELPHLGQACQQCALPLATATDTLCPRCLRQPPSNSSCHACWYYAYPVAQLIQRFKYRADLTAGRTLAEVAAQQLAPAVSRDNRPDLLVPMPLHWRRQLARGYNQAQLIADIWGRRWQIPVNNRLLRKAVFTGSQQQLKREERLKNLSRSFAASNAVKGRHIGLVDDVITTGASLEAASATLLTAGARLVSTYALARTP